MFEGRLFILAASLLHAFWATLLSLDIAAVSSTTLWSLYRSFYPPRVLVMVLIGSAVIAIWGLWLHKPFWIVMSLLPQQILLCISAGGAVEAILESQYADGVPRPRAFIAADQIYAIGLAFGHLVAIVQATYSQKSDTINALISERDSLRNIVSRMRNAV